MKISFCFVHRSRLTLGNDGESLPLFKNCLLTLRSCLEALRVDDYEIVVSSWDNNEDFRELHRYLFQSFQKNKVILIRHLKKNIPQDIIDNNSDAFSRGKGLNHAADASSGDIIGFLDADMLFVRTVVIEEAIKNIIKNIAYFPICYSLRKDGSGFWRPTGLGNCFVSKKMFKESRWEELWEWGGEDNNFYDNIQKAGYNVCREKCPGWYHQWHPREVVGWHKEAMINEHK